MVSMISTQYDMSGWYLWLSSFKNPWQDMIFINNLVIPIPEISPKVVSSD